MTPTRKADLFRTARDCLLCSDVEKKLRQTAAAEEAWRAGGLVCDDGEPPVAIGHAGRPGDPQLVAPGKLPRRKLSSPAGQAALVHSIAHIEFNAINLAWDAVYRFRGLPGAYYGDWIRVAAEEAKHFALLRERLRQLGYDYGSFVAHNGLWEAARRTAHDPLVRMALVPRVLEARGLDVTPGMMNRLRAIGDGETVEILRIILRDEIGHVEIGSRWYRYLCGRRGVDPDTTYRQLLEEYRMEGAVRGPLHRSAREQAGFSAGELDYLEGLIRSG